MRVCGPRCSHNDDVLDADGPSELISLRRVLAARYVVVGLALVTSAVVAGGRGDWNQFVEVGQQLFGDAGLDVFVRNGDAQTGPLALAIARALSLTPRNGFFVSVIVCGALGLLSLRLLELTSRRERKDDQRTALATLLGGLLLAFAWGKLGGYGHLDDALVLAAAAIALHSVSRERAYTAAIVIGLSIAIKPWSVIFLPITLTGSRRPLIRRWRPPALAVALGASIWAPFLIAAPATLRSLRPTVAVAGDSVLRLLGVGDATVPSWLRVVQLSLACVVALVAVLRGRYEGVILAAIAVRLAVDPGTWSYYTPGFLLGALAWDLRATRRVFPVLTLAGTVLLAPTWLVPDDLTRAVLRLVGCLGAIVVVLVSGRAPSVDRRRPTSGPSGGG
jgi:hypothetical protein